MSEDLERAVAAAKERLDRATDAVTLAEHHYESLEAHHKSGKSWTTHNDAELKADFDARYQLMKKAYAEKSTAEGRYNDLELQLRNERQRKRELAAKAAREAALEDERKRKAEPQKKPEAAPGREPEFEP